MSLSKALCVVKEAIIHEENGNLSDALIGYESAIQHFIDSVELNEVTVQHLKDEIKEQAEFYMKRMDSILSKLECAQIEGKIVQSTSATADLKMSKQSSTCEADAELINRISSTVINEKTDVNFSNVCGLEKEKCILEQAVILPIKFPELFSEGLSPYKGFLFFGPPGTGKTFIARAVAGEASSTTFFSISASDLISKYQGESESLVKNLFAVARLRKPSIIFIDEIDSLAMSRTDSDNDSSRRVKTELFVQMDGVASENAGVFVMAATNTPYNLDDAILRRFDKLIYIPLPDENARIDMFRQMLMDETSEITENDLLELGRKTDGLSGSDIAVMCKKAKMQCIERLQKSTHFREVIKCGTKYFEPCSSKRKNAIKMNLADVPAGKLLFTPFTTKEDAIKCVMTAKARIDSSQISKLEKFAEEKGEWSVKNSLEVTAGRKRTRGEKVLGFILNFF